MEEVIVECPICLEQPRLPIEHVKCHKFFCKDCLKPLFASKTPRCPFCREVLDSVELGLEDVEEAKQESLRYQCPLCEADPLDSVNLIVHIEDNHYEASGDCPICLLSGVDEVFHEELMPHLRDCHDFDYEMYQEHMDLSEDELIAEIIERSRVEFAN